MESKYLASLLASIFIALAGCAITTVSTELPALPATQKVPPSREFGILLELGSPDAVPDVAALVEYQQQRIKQREVEAGMLLVAPTWLDDREFARFRSAMGAISADASRIYRDLVYGTADFNHFFRALTPITEISELKIGSRPASRTKSDRIEDLRAIPWVFSWAQARVMLPGWFGTGAALAAFSDRGLLAEMVDGWPFLKATLSNLEMVLAKSDMDIAAQYAGLVGDLALRNAIFTRIRDAWMVTHDQLLSLTGQANLLDHQPALQHGVMMRLPYINPLNTLQIDLIRRRRAGDQDPRIAEGIHLTINGIAAGLRNSG